MATIVADTGALISLGLIKKVELIEKVLGEFFIPNAVWVELQEFRSELNADFFNYLSSKRIIIKTKNTLSLVMDFGESESVILYKEIGADFLLIDDQKARKIAESLGVNCIGAIGILILAKKQGFLDNLKDIFILWLRHKRYYSKTILNKVLSDFNESLI